MHNADLIHCSLFSKCAFEVQFFDEDGSGTITRQEMKEKFKELGGLLSDEEIELFHDILDGDGNGVIDVRILASDSLTSVW
jgi:Ca2+-binding EF-hand superfamily protein